MDCLAFGLLLLACACAATTGAMFPTGAWHAQLRKPTWVPPHWVFPLVWSSLYPLMAFARAEVAPRAAVLAMVF